MALVVCLLSTAGRTEEVRLDCVMDPSSTLKLGSAVAGVLRSVEVRRGQRVRAGEIVARLEAGMEEATVALNEARAENTAEIQARRLRVEHAELELARASRLVQGSYVSAQKLDELRVTLRAAQQDLAIAELNRRLAELELARSRAALEQRLIRSPIDALVTERVLGPGEYVHQDTHVAVLAATDPLHVEAYPPVRLFGGIRVGDPAVVYPDPPVGGAWPATVSVTDEVFDPGSGTFGIRATLPNPDRLPAGLRCRVAFPELARRMEEAQGAPRPR
jgi:RND family efflux transporter MFP subunit